MHTMNILNIKINSYDDKAYAMMIGGLTSKDRVLNDVWLLDLFNLQWVELEIKNANSEFLRR